MRSAKIIAEIELLDGFVIFCVHPQRSWRWLWRKRWVGCSSSFPNDQTKHGGRSMHSPPFRTEAEAVAEAHRIIRYARGTYGDASPSAS